MTDTASAPPEFDTAAATGQVASPRVRQWLAPAWFLLGMLVGMWNEPPQHRRPAADDVPSSRLHRHGADGATHDDPRYARTVPRL